MINKNKVAKFINKALQQKKKSNSLIEVLNNKKQEYTNLKFTDKEKIHLFTILIKAFKENADEMFLFGCIYDEEFFREENNCNNIKERLLKSRRDKTINCIINLLEILMELLDNF